jgi:hypothetical protein
MLAKRSRKECPETVRRAGALSKLAFGPMLISPALKRCGLLRPRAKEMTGKIAEMCNNYMINNNILYSLPRRKSPMTVALSRNAA